MVQKHVAFAPGNKWGQAPFCKKEDILIQKMGPVPIFLITELDILTWTFDLGLSLCYRFKVRLANKNKKNEVLCCSI